MAAQGVNLFRNYMGILRPDKKETKAGDFAYSKDTTLNISYGQSMSNRYLELVKRIREKMNNEISALEANQSYFILVFHTWTRWYWTELQAMLQKPLPN
jgi:hypothetical protein